MVPSNTDVSKTETIIRTEQYRDIQTFEDALQLAQASGMEIISSEDLGDGFSRADQADLLKVPLVCLAVLLKDGDKGEYVVCRVVTKHGEKYAFSDSSSTGVNFQLREYMAGHAGKWPVLWNHGLRESNYRTTDATGREIDATTYYIDTSK